MITETEFKSGMRNFAAAVNVMGVMQEETASGMLATAMCSVCAQPPIVLVCNNKSASIHDILRSTENFCISVLKADQMAIARKFMESDKAERFSQCEWETVSTGAPAIQGALLNFDCVLHSQFEAGTHTTFFGRVVDLRPSTTRQPLLYHNADFATMEPVFDSLSA